MTEISDIYVNMMNNTDEMTNEVDTTGFAALCSQHGFKMMKYGGDTAYKYAEENPLRVDVCVRVMESDDRYVADINVNETDVVLMEADGDSPVAAFNALKEKMSTLAGVINGVLE